LYKFGIRYYDPTFGRWTQQDPLGGRLFDPSTGNRYAYTNDDPTNLTDLTGYSTGLDKGVAIAWLITGTCVLTAVIGSIATAGATAPLWVGGFELCAGLAGFSAGVGSVIQAFFQ